MTNKKILYFDMDNVLVDFPSGIALLSEETQKEYEERLDEVPGIFSLTEPLTRLNLFSLINNNKCQH